MDINMEKYTKIRRYLNNLPDETMVSHELGRLIFFFNMENKSALEDELRFLSAKVEEFNENYPEMVSDESD